MSQMSDKQHELLESISPSDEGFHDDSDDPRYQESWFFVWNDLASGSAGYHHLGVQTNRGIADAWNWLAVDGRVAGRFQSHELPMPAGDYTNIDVAGIACRTVETFREYAVEVSYPGTEATASLTFRPITVPLAFSWGKTGGTLDTGHYEFVGRVTGEVTDGSSTYAVDTFGMMDRSWGPRDLGTLLSHRAVQAFFGEDLFVSVHCFTTEKGTNGLGWIFEGGEFRQVVRTQFRVEVDQDGHSPLSCDVRFFTEDGRGYHITGSVDLSSPTYRAPHYFPTTGMGMFELGGRVGSGYVEINELAVPSPALRREMGLTGEEGDS